MLETLLIFRELAVRYFKMFEPFIKGAARFLLGWYIFSGIHGIGYVLPEVAEIYGQFPMTLLLTVGFTLLPLTLSYLLVILAVTVQLTANLELAAVVFLFLLLLLLFYGRMAARESILIILTIVAFRFGLAYLIPLIAGLYFSFTAIIPVAIGVFIASYIPAILGIIEVAPTAGLEFMEMQETFLGVYEALVSILSGNNDWIFTAFIFGMVIVLVRLISRLSINFSKEIAIGLGCALMIFGYIMAALVSDIALSLGGVIIGTLFSGVLALIMRLFDPVLDYQRAESVQFEDDTNFYYVRVVPKIQISRPTRVVRRIRPHSEEDLP